MIRETSDGLTWSRLHQWTQVEQLDANGCAMPVQDNLEALAKLEELFLGRNNMGDGGCSAFADAAAKGAMAQLKELHLQYNQVGDGGVSSLASACAKGAMAQLTDLRLWANQIGDAGIT